MQIHAENNNGINKDCGECSAAIAILMHLVTLRK
jgi:hypothetical protein